jgi:hypothetical protein
VDLDELEEEAGIKRDGEAMIMINEGTGHGIDM